MMNKKRICLITNWYPTKENPYMGLFFKEQAFATEDHLDYIVLHYQEKRKSLLLPYLVRKILKTDVLIQKINEERNIKEYSITVRCLAYLRLCDLLYNFFCKYDGRTIQKFLNRYISNPYEVWKKKKLKKSLSASVLRAIWCTLLCRCTARK